MKNTISIMIKLSIALTILPSLFISAAYSSDNNKKTSNSYTTEYSLPDDAIGVVFIDSTTTGSLLQLRGIFGKGILLTKNINKQTCIVSRLKLAAGDFGGSNISVHSSGPIRLDIYSREVVEKLNAGVEVVSEDYLITDLLEEKIGDIKISMGLSIKHGFVLNPINWSWLNIFDNKKNEVAC
ncbi:hypothetical protein TW85_04025 [Marinomonas sp. S3726]|nr:hypothetical protein TW85_04025 [Marinomonas sp. S3726]